MLYTLSMGRIRHDGFGVDRNIWSCSDRVLFPEENMLMSSFF